jgi:hypothetical protein
MKSALPASLIACLLALAAGCSSTDGSADPQTHANPGAEAPATLPSNSSAAETPAGSSTSLLSQSLTAPPGSGNPCAAATCLAGTNCEVVAGQAVCTPLQPSGPSCGGFAGIACPGSGSCVDDPGDGCDPENGGADCGGICECNIRALCVRGLVFDSSADVCACVPREPEPDACARVRCRAGTHCEVVDDRALCTRDEAPNPCAAVLCPAPSTCEVLDGQAVCTTSEPPNPCAATSCLAGTSCEVVDGQAVCTPNEPSGPFCGGFAGIACPGSGSCVDNPGDGCDPEHGGADCGGICECNIRALCVRGLVFDASPEVCACVPAPDACAAVRCRAGTHCELADDGASCAPDEPINPCAAVLCPAPSSCDVVDGKAVCTPIEPSGPFCGGIAAFQCPGGGSCVDNPNDGCDPARGGADCGGICECRIEALCIRGFVFDRSPEVCACVPAGTGSGPECPADAG